MSSRYGIDDLLMLMARLRDPDSGCPWDLQQSFASIVPHTLEECYELADAIEQGDHTALGDELGDLLFQVVFYARLGEESQLFDFETVVDGIVQKLLRRHPHVFPDGRLSGERHPQAPSAAEVSERWEAIKARERREKQQHSTLDDIPLALPALTRSLKLQRRAGQVGFDWDAPEPIWEKVGEELAELQRARQGGDPAAIQDEMGDVLFACVNLARHLGVDPEAALRGTGRKFERRFRYVEAQLRDRGLAPVDTDLATMDALWEAAKRRGL